MDEYDIYSHSPGGQYTAPIPGGFNPEDDNSVSFGPAPENDYIDVNSDSDQEQPYLINNRPISQAFGGYPPPYGAYPPPQYQPPYQQPYQQPGQYYAPKDPGKGNTVASLICASVSIVIVRSGLLSLAIGIIALVLAVISRNKTRASGIPLRTESTAALVASIIAVVLSSIMTVIQLFIFMAGFSMSGIMFPY